MADNKIKIKVFNKLCRHCCCLMYGWVPLPCTAISRQLGISLYKCRQAMKTLVAEGLAVRTSCILDPEESMLPYHGFAVTEKGKKTGIYKYNAQKEARICASVFGESEEGFLWALCGTKKLWKGDLDG